MKYSTYSMPSLSDDEVLEMCSDYMINGTEYGMKNHVYSGNFRNKEEFFTTGYHICMDVADYVIEYDLFYRFLVVSALEEIVK